MAVPRAAALARRLVRAAGDGARAPSRALRPFSCSPAPLRRRPAAAAAAASSDVYPGPAAAAPDGPTPARPLDFASLIAAYEVMDAHFSPRVARAVAGARFQPEALGALPVLVKADGRTFPLRELAQVVQRPGERVVSLLATDRAYIKPLMSALQASPLFNQQPKRVPDNDLELLLRVEHERPDDVARRVRLEGQAWRDRARQLRNRIDRLFKEWQRTGAMLPDVARRAETELLRLQGKKLREIEDAEGRALRLLQRNSSVQ